MRLVIHSILTLCLVTLLLIPAPALAESAINCHCFKDRSYDPGRPAIADPYFLATTQNSFFAAVFAIDKKLLVAMKQFGFSSDDLWIAHWLSSRSGADPNSLLEDLNTRETWQQVATPLAIPAKSMGLRVAEALKSNVANKRLAEAVLDELLLRNRFHAEAELNALRKTGAGNQEMILAGLLAAKTGQAAIKLYQEVKTGRTSWGALLHGAKVGSAEIQPEVAAMVKAANGSKAK